MSFFTNYYCHIYTKDSEPFNLIIDPSYGMFTDKGQRSTRPANILRVLPRTQFSSTCSYICLCVFIIRYFKCVANVFSNTEISSDYYFYLLYLQTQITASLICVRIVEPAQTVSTNTRAVVLLDMKEQIVKRVSKLQVIQ